MNPTNQPVSFYGDNSRNTDSALLAALATKQPYEYDYNGMVSAGGISDLREEVKDVGSNIRSDIGDVKSTVKDAECSIRHDIGKAEAVLAREILREGQDNMKATMQAECNLSKEILESRHTLAKDILRSEYENKLALQAAIKEINLQAQHNAERTQDKIDHGFEEINEKLCECCEEAAVRGVAQTGLLNTIISAVVK
jgi:hypothetical protein